MEQPKSKQETGVTEAHTVPTIPNVMTVLAHLCKYLDLGQQLLLLGRGSWHRKGSCAPLCSDLSHSACSFVLVSSKFINIQNSVKSTERINPGFIHVQFGLIHSLAKT